MAVGGPGPERMMSFDGIWIAWSPGFTLSIDMEGGAIEECVCACGRYSRPIVYAV